LEERVRGRDERDPADTQTNGSRAAPRRHGHKVAGRRLQRRRELLVEHDLARSKRAAKEPEDRKVVRVVLRDGEQRAAARLNRSCSRG
jgi:hypothetical protein